MATWTDITDAQIDPDAPLTSELAYAWRDNVVAVAEGAVGAPRIEDAALDGTVTSVGVSWTGARYAGVAVGAVGSTVFATHITSGGGAVSPGGTVAGSVLRYANVSNDGGSTTTLPGSWMCCGRIAHGATGRERTTVWKRVS